LVIHEHEIAFGMDDLSASISYTLIDSTVTVYPIHKD